MLLGNYSVIISSNDMRLQEYQVEKSEDGRTVCCWITSNEGQAFSVHCKLGGGNDVIRIKVLADGELLDKRIADRLPNCVLSGNRISELEKKQYEFARGVIPVEDYDEDERDAEPNENWNERGKITVELYHVQVTYGPLYPQEPPSYYTTDTEVFRTVTIGASISSVRHKSKTILSVEAASAEDEQPFATFHFKHRPQEWLEAYRIIPPLPDFSALDLDDSPSSKRRRSPTPLLDKAMARVSFFDTVDHAPKKKREDDGSSDIDEESEESDDVPSPTKMRRAH